MLLLRETRQRGPEQDERDRRNEKAWRSGLDAGCAAHCLAAQAHAQDGPSTTLCATVSTARDFAPAGGLYYKENFEQSAGNGRVPERRSSATARGALKLTVKPICPAREDGCSERAEIWEKTELRVPYDQGVWYGFAVKFADPVPAGRPPLSDRAMEARDRARRARAISARSWRCGCARASCSPRSRPTTSRRNAGGRSARRRAARRARRRSGCGPTPTRCGRWWRPTPTGAPRTATSSPTAPMRSASIDHGNPLPAPASGWIDFAIYTQARSGRLRPHRDLRQRQAGRDGHRPYRPCRQGARRQPVFQVRPLPRRA